ncbi:uncharacterized protein [Amphiura filiformis]|uniref:uncharacterized protein n=1 Tax=Amphiura filiformis TaxID=82378 RepID=UPI003B2223CC
MTLDEYRNRWVAVVSLLDKPWIVMAESTNPDPNKNDSYTGHLQIGQLTESSWIPSIEKNTRYFTQVQVHTIRGTPFMYILSLSQRTKSVIHRFDALTSSVSRMQRLPKASGALMFEDYYDGKPALLLMLFVNERRIRMFAMPQNSSKFILPEVFGYSFPHTTTGKCIRTGEVLCFVGSPTYAVTVLRWDGWTLHRVHHNITKLHNLELANGEESIDTVAFHGHVLVAVSERKNLGNSKGYFEFDHIVHIFTLPNNGQFDAASVQTLQDIDEDIYMCKFIQHEQHLYLLVGLFSRVLVYKYNQFGQFELTASVLQSATSAAYFTTYDGQSLLVTARSYIRNSQYSEFPKSSVYVL